MKRLLLAAVTFGAVILPAIVAVAQQTNLPPSDQRYGKPKTLNDYFPFQPPPTREAWEQRKRQLREQVLVANGLGEKRRRGSSRSPRWTGRNGSCMGAVSSASPIRSWIFQASRPRSRPSEGTLKVRSAKSLS